MTEPREPNAEGQALEEKIQQRATEIGRGVFSALHDAKPPAFSKDYWAGKMLEWSMNRPELKANLLRLVDVLPSLTSSAAIAGHVSEYVGPYASDVSGILHWGVRGAPHSLRGRITAIAVRTAVRQMASQFIAGETPEKAVGKLIKMRREGFAFTVDLLGEYSVSEREALAYLERYLHAIRVMGEAFKDNPAAAPLSQGHVGDSSPVCVSVKLSALYSQCHALNFDRSAAVLSERLATIVREAVRWNAQVYVDAEDTGHNDIIYEVFARVFSASEFRAVPYPGIVVQAYLRNSGDRITQLLEVARRRDTPIAIRLVKGAYWDSETALCQQRGWEIPVFREKWQSDLQFERLSRTLLRAPHLCLPAFGSHNIRSLAHALASAEQLGVPPTQFEVQVLYGMAEPIARAFRAQGSLVRQYVPLGDLIPGMGYFVRRLLENSSNESFLRHAFAEQRDRDKLLAPPHRVRATAQQPEHTS